MVYKMRIRKYIGKFSELKSLKINNGKIQNQQISKVTNGEAQKYKKMERN